MENETVEETVRNQYDFVNRTITYYQTNKEKISFRK